MRWVYALLLCVAGASLLFANAWDQSAWHPLGVDEYGRDSLRALIAATASSVWYASVLLVLALILPTGMAWLAEVRKIATATWLLRASSQVIEAIPAILLVLAAIAAFPAGGFYLVAIVFAFVVLPSVGNLLAGELNRLMQTGFVQVALMQQTPAHTLLFRYFLPNATSVLRPLLLQLFGSAMTVIGAVGVLGSLA
jgi:ABC-type dipeptide/oligopeptide/nickel transport system permease subunit